MMFMAIKYAFLIARSMPIRRVVFAQKFHVTGSLCWSDNLGKREKSLASCQSKQLLLPVNQRLGNCHCKWSVTLNDEACIGLNNQPVVSS